jgi:hypothetical protein
MIPDLNICPACLMELPAGYRYDHVRIDRVLGGDRALWLAMRQPERREAVLTGIGRRVYPQRLAELLDISYHHVQGVLPDEHPQSRASFVAAAEEKVVRLWMAGATYSEISAASGLDPRTVTKVRHARGLPDRPRRKRPKKAMAWA